MNSIYGNLTNNHRFKKYIIGYGLSFGQNTWRLNYGIAEPDTLPPSRPPVTISSQSLGFVFQNYIQTGKRFHLGIVYRPSILNLNMEPRWQYEHLISLDLAWKIRLK